MVALGWHLAKLYRFKVVFCCLGMTGNALLFEWSDRLRHLSTSLFQVEVERLGFMFVLPARQLVLHVGSRIIRFLRMCDLPKRKCMG